MFPFPYAEVAITQERGITTFWFNSTNTEVATFLFNFCDILPCANKHVPWRCDQSGRQNNDITAYICVTSTHWGENCDYWGSAGWNSGISWGYQPKEALDRKDDNGETLLTRMTLVRQSQCTDRFILSIRQPQSKDGGHYVLGSYGKWGSSRRKFALKDMYRNSEYASGVKTLINPLLSHISAFKNMIAIANPSFDEVVALETGFSDLNLWLEWMKFTADKHNQSNCYVCSNARPHLGTVPLNIPTDQEECFLSLYDNTHVNDTQCESWKKEYPILSKNPNPGNTITIYPGNYTCYVSNLTSGHNFGTFPTGYCSERRYTYVGNHTRSPGDIFWVCGDMKLRTKIDTPWKGECALAKILMPFHILSERQEPIDAIPSTRTKRDLTPGGSLDPHVYIDSIGVPRGVPNEFKARDQVAAGFESLIPIITINKNVDWINYIYYNQQRFVNYTRDALQGTAEQLEANSQMTFQNRMALF